VVREASAFEQRMPQRLEVLLNVAPVPMEVALKHAWNQDDRLASRHCPGLEGSMDKL